jgi:hypothetical protein
MSFIVGLTGGIGSGKTTVADLFARRGAALVDTDAIAHELTGPQGAAMAAISAAFGAAVLRPDGGLDRAAMRAVVFSDSSAKARLEAILHPLIRQQSAARCKAATSAPYVLLVVPLLVERAVIVSVRIGCWSSTATSQCRFPASWRVAVLPPTPSRRSWQRKLRGPSGGRWRTMWCSTRAGWKPCCRRSKVCTCAILIWPGPNLMLAVEVLLQMIQNHGKSPFPTLAAV